MIDYLLKFQSKEVAEQFALANGFAKEVDGVIKSSLVSREHALHEIGKHNGKDYWVLFRDLVGVPVPEEGNQFIVWSSNMTINDEADVDAVKIPRPKHNPDIPSTFWA